MYSNEATKSISPLTVQCTHLSMWIPGIEGSNFSPFQVDISLLGIFDSSWSEHRKSDPPDSVLTREKKNQFFFFFLFILSSLLSRL